MHNLRHFYYQNKEKIWKVVLIIAFLLGIIYFLNRNVMEESNPNLYTSNSNINYTDEQNKTYISEKSAISGGTVTQKEVNQLNNTISKFLQYCKSGDAEQAYNMLSKDCQEECYNTVEKFQKNYLKSKFDKNSIYEIKKWINNTYKVSISKDILATGNIKDNAKFIEYITIEKEGIVDKLNISGYVGKQEINKETIQDQIKITTINKKKYIDYEIYEFKIENLTNKTIKIDTLEKIGTMYLKDIEGRKYNAYGHEILDDNLELKTKEIVNISIKFAKTYTNTEEIEKIVFKNIISDYIKYVNMENKKDYKDIIELEIDL